MLGIIYNSLALVKSLRVQIATFVFYTSFRAFLYAVMAAFAAETFGIRVSCMQAIQPYVHHC